MTYLDAPATRLLATHCLVCSRPLVDAISVEVGIGPVCRGRVDLTPATLAAQPAANALVHEAALAATSDDRRIEIADAVRALGFAVLADRMLERFLGRASLSVQVAHGMMPDPVVTIERGTFRFYRKEEAAVFVAFDSYRGPTLDAMKEAIGYRDRKWLSDRKAWAIKASKAGALNAALTETLAGMHGVGPLGPFVIGERTDATAAPDTTDADSTSSLVEQLAAIAVDAAIEKGARDYQTKGIHWLATVGMEENGVVLADDMGLGKTMQAVLALPLRECRALVIAPKTLLINWKEEVARWRPDLTPVVLKGAKGFRFPEKGEVLITNYAGLPARLAVKAEGQRFATAELTPAEAAALAETVLILDEAEAVTNWKAKRTERIRCLRFGARAAWALTGTPMASRAQQLWGLLATLGMARAVFGSFGEFVDLMGGQRKRYGGFAFDADRVDSERCATALRTAMLRRTKADALPELPPKTRVEVTVPTPRALRRTLDGVFGRWTEAERGELPAFTEMAAVRRQLAESKVAAMLDRVSLAEMQDRPLVVYSAHRAPIDALRGREGWRVITGDESTEQRAEAVRRFQAGELRGIGITSAGARGITLTHASSMLMVDLPWTPAEVDQVEDRICRIGQTAAGLTYTRLVSDHPLDLHVLRILDAKRELLAATVDAATVAPAGATAHVEAR